MPALSVLVISDVVCPWCLIGTERLHQALAQRPAVESDVEMAPFLLDAAVPAGGQDLRERLRKKYGADPEAMFGRVEAAARASGIPLDFRKVTRWSDTIGAHVLIERARDKGTQVALARDLFHAYFLEGRDLSDPDVLARVASAHGFETDEALALVADGKERDAVKTAAREASQQGVSGVPFFVFGGKYALSGAQPVDVFLQAIDKAVADLTT
jgi:predicted DsbA family dithiol-disulfide isomerase